jgi:hypothetical protein
MDINELNKYEDSDEEEEDLRRFLQGGFGAK